MQPYQYNACTPTSIPQAENTSSKYFTKEQENHYNKTSSV